MEIATISYHAMLNILCFCVYVYTQLKCSIYKKWGYHIGGVSKQLSNLNMLTCTFIFQVN